MHPTTNADLNDIRVDVEAGNWMPISEEISGHVGAHVAETDEADTIARRVCFFRRQRASRNAEGRRGEGGRGGDRGEERNEFLLWL